MISLKKIQQWLMSLNVLSIPQVYAFSELIASLLPFYKKLHKLTQPFPLITKIRNKMFNFPILTVKIFNTSSKIR